MVRYAHSTQEGHMAKRKPTDKAQLNIRMTEALRRKIATEAEKNGWSLNRELVRRLEQSFVQQGAEALIKNTALTVAIEVSKNVVAHLDGVIDEFNKIYRLLGRPDLVIELKKGEDSNG
jgi:uncharacterized protein (DUF1778 family)